jgi:hypothetical protein
MISEGGAIGAIGIGWGGVRTTKKTFHIAILFITHPTLRDQKSNPGRRDPKPAAK